MRFKISLAGIVWPGCSVVKPAMSMITKSVLSLITLIVFLTASAQQKPNVIFILADDLGYGDVSCNGATGLQTPNIDKLASQGLRFTNAHTTSATCTPSRYAIMTGEYPWRRQGTGILPGDAKLIIPTDRTTLPRIFKQAGYTTAIVGKWHLGLGTSVEKNWNSVVKPGPNEVGFDYSFIFPATADRVPTIFLENERVIGLEADDTILVDYKKKIGNDPTGKENPELLKMKSSNGQGHDNTIVNGIGRIGFMSGGKTARWTDEELSFTFLNKAKEVINSHKREPFFLCLNVTEPHVPRMPATMFKGKSGLGFRGDAILQLDWTVGQILQQLVDAGIDQNTIIIFSSDNGPVLDDGYQDDAVTKANGHKPAGMMRGGKYSVLEGGTRVPFIVSWPAKIKPAVSDALMCQIDLAASFASMLQVKIPAGDARDSEDQFNAMIGKNKQGRTVLIEQGGPLAIIKDGWKYIMPSEGRPYDKLVGIETGCLPTAQLYDLKNDVGETNNVAEQYPDKVKALEAALQAIKQQ